MKKGEKMGRPRVEEKAIGRISIALKEEDYLFLKELAKEKNTKPGYIAKKVFITWLKDKKKIY